MLWIFILFDELGSPVVLQTSVKHWPDAALMNRIVTLQKTLRNQTYQMNSGLLKTASGTTVTHFTARDMEYFRLSFLYFCVETTISSSHSHNVSTPVNLIKLPDEEKRPCPCFKMWVFFLFQETPLTFNISINEDEELSSF